MQNETPHDMDRRIEPQERLGIYRDAFESGAPQFLCLEWLFDKFERCEGARTWK